MCEIIIHYSTNKSIRMLKTLQSFIIVSVEAAGHWWVPFAQAEAHSLEPGPAEAHSLAPAVQVPLLTSLETPQLAPVCALL